MTTLAAFVSIDHRRPTAYYLASDSRITWGASHRRWDAGRKVFASLRHPHAFGYAGDVVFPSLVLTQLIELIDTDSLLSETDSPDDAHAKIVTSVRDSFHLRRNAPDENFSILHVLRQGSGNESSFALWQLSYEKSTQTWKDQRHEVPLDRSSLVLALGTGSASIRRHESTWRNSSQGGTTRSIYGAFAEALKAGGDRHSGGAPQLVGIYKRGAAKSIGIVHQGMRYLSGLPVPNAINPEKLEWRDELFQRIDGKTLAVLEGAQRHARPKMEGPG